MKTALVMTSFCKKAAGSLGIIAFLAADAGLSGRPLLAQSTKDCRVIERKIAEAIVDNPPPVGTYAASVYWTNKAPAVLRAFQARFPNCYIARPNPVPHNSATNSLRVFNCQGCLRHLKRCRETLADMKSSSIRTYAVEAGMEVSCQHWETSCQESCSGL
jgi:hypothetical protein